MDKQKQIEELAVILRGQQKWCDISYPYEIAKLLYNAGYCKIPEGSVVLTKEEYAELKSLANNHCKYCHLMDLPDFETEKIVRDTTRKETAEKFADKLLCEYIDSNDCDEVLVGVLRVTISKICKEITEGKL